jgi:hypothetical protein
MGYRSIRSWVLATFVITAAATAEAQGSGYVVAGPAGVSGFFGSSATSMHAAAGGEALMGGRVGVAGEAGLLANSSNVLWVVSANGVVHLARAQVSPFITGGYTRMGSAEGGFNAWNAGAGMDVWAKPRLGFRLDFRDHIRPDERGTVHYWTVRGGVVFR